MSEDSKLPREVFKIPPEPEENGKSLRLRCRRHIGFIKTAEFSGGLGCAVGAASVGGDMYLVVPLLAVGLILVALGILASNLSPKSAIIWCAIAFTFFMGEGAILHLHFFA
jgi:hypothetical protein